MMNQIKIGAFISERRKALDAKPVSRKQKAGRKAS